MVVTLMIVDVNVVNTIREGAYSKERRHFFGSVIAVKLPRLLYPTVFGSFEYHLILSDGKEIVDEGRKKAL